MEGPTITLKQFNEKLKGLMPYYTEDKNMTFYERTEACLKEYLSLVNKLSIEGQPLSDDLKQDIFTICDDIYKMVTASMMGKTSEAFKLLDGLLRGDNERHCRIGLEGLVRPIMPGHSFYRIRLKDSIYGAKRKDLFHISNKSRGQVRSYRYSSPGYPCLYLGESIYGCWEEMRRPPIHRCAVARFENEKEILIIDMTIPTEVQLKNESCLRQIPMIMACSIRVSDEEATYRPEYIIPQLLIEWLLTHRMYGNAKRKAHVYGIMYHSAQMNKDFGFPKNKFINYAIPIFNVDEKVDYCQRLCDTFKLTKATTNEQEKLKEGYSDPIVETSKAKTKEEEKYIRSDFGQLERRLGNEKEFPLAKINYKDGTDRRS